MVKWQPFASLPEHANYIRKVIYEMNKIERPVLSEDQLNELNEKLYRYSQTKEPVSMTYYHDGYIYEVEGVIVKIELLTKMIIIENNSKRDKFSIENILDIKLK